MLERVKLALRLTTDAFDSEISDIISACEADLGIAGVTVSESPLIIRAVILYAKAEFGNNADAAKFREAYLALKTYLSIAQIGGEDD